MSEKYKYKSFSQPGVDRLVKAIKHDPRKRLLNVKLKQRCSDYYILVEYIEETGEKEIFTVDEVELIK